MVFFALCGDFLQVSQEKDQIACRAQRDDEPGGGLVSTAPVEEPTPEHVSRGKIKQVGLFDKVSQGRFKDVEATVVEGKNLDIPTFKRRGIMIQKVLRNHTN